MSTGDGILHDLLDGGVSKALAQRVVVSINVRDGIELHASRNVHERTVKVSGVDRVERGCADILSPEVQNLLVFRGEVSVVDVIHGGGAVVHDGAAVVGDSCSLRSL